MDHIIETPEEATITRRNFRNVQIDAIGVGLAGAAAPFLPVFLTRLHASTFEISLLTTMPAVTGLLLAIPLGRFLQQKSNVVPWFSAARLLYILAYAITGMIAFVFKDQPLVIAIIVVWALATIPQTLLAITFSVVMNAVAGPTRRYELMTRRWSIVGVTTSLTVFLIGQVLEWLKFPNNYQVVFIGLSLGGLMSYYFSSHIKLNDMDSPLVSDSRSIKQGIIESIDLVKRQKPFMSFTLRRFVYLTGVSMTLPLFPIYFVREVNAPDNWIAAFNTIQTSIIVIGYFFWSRQSRVRGSKYVLLITTAGMSLYPILTALTRDVWVIALYAGIAGIFQAGIDLVFFDELMKTIPVEYSATFVSVAQSIQYVSTIFAPLLGSLLADTMGVGAGLIIGGLFRLAGFLLFFFEKN